jgi:hypothetical protein
MPVCPFMKATSSQLKYKSPVTWNNQIGNQVRDGACQGYIPNHASSPNNRITPLVHLVSAPCLLVCLRGPGRGRTTHQRRWIQAGLNLIKLINQWSPRMSGTPVRSRWETASASVTVALLALTKLQCSVPLLARPAGRHSEKSSSSTRNQF